MRILKPLLTFLLLVAIGRYLWLLARDWRQQTGDFRVNLHPLWLALSAALYILGMLLFGLFWGRLLSASGIRIPTWELLRTYLVGGLGKYVPGKAFVLILRTGMVQHHHVRKLPIVLSVFYETLAMMAAGAAIAAGCLLFLEPRRWPWWSASLAVVAVLGPTLHPGLFERLSRFLAKPFTDDSHHPSAAPWLQVLFRSGYLLIGAWVLLGLSGMAAAGGVGLTSGSVRDAGLMTGAVALACSAGFVVVFMPSGIGVREFIIVTLLSPRYGAGAAIAVSLVLRTIWTIADLVAAGGVYPIRPAATAEPALTGPASERPPA